VCAGWCGGGGGGGGGGGEKGEGVYSDYWGAGDRGVGTGGGTPRVHAGCMIWVLKLNMRGRVGRESGKGGKGGVGGGGGVSLAARPV